MIDKLTKEQEELKSEIRDKWINRALKNPSFDEEKAKELVRYCYELAGKNIPEIVITNSPLHNQENCSEFVWPYYVLADCGWIAFYDFFVSAGIVKHEVFEKYSRLVYDSGVWEMVAFEDVCYVCPCPLNCRRNANDALHSDQAPAIEWAGFELYFLNGVEFEKSVWEKIVNQEFTLEDLVQSGLSADANAVAIQFLRPDRLLQHVKAELINTGFKGTKLYKVPNFLDTGDTQYCMLMECPSTGRKFIEWVDPEIGATGDADLAQASSFIDSDGQSLSIEDYLTMVEA